MNRYKKDYTRYEDLEGWEKKTFGEQLENWAGAYENKIAVSDGAAGITYRELHEAASVMAYGFLDAGIKCNDNVLVQLPNRISFVVTLFALAKIGAVPIMALPAHREEELGGIIKLARPTAYIVADRYLGYDYLPMARMLKDRYDFVKLLIVDGEDTDTERLMNIRGLPRQLPETDGYSTAVLLLSGGTTGVPKLIPRTHTDYIYSARMSAARCRLDEDSIYLAALPIAHNFSLCCPGLLGTLDRGGTVILCKNTGPDEILELITEKHITITALVPAMVTVCMEMMEWDECYDISSLKILQVGGAVLEDSLADKIIAGWPGRLMQVFGTAEGLLSFTGVDDQDEIVARCQGTPISPADEIRLVDDNGVDVPEGEYGELLSRGPYTIDGYYLAPEANERSFTADGYYRTGDRAMITKEGNLRLGGRITEQINRAGEKVMPAEVEGYLCRYEPIREAAVVGIPDEELGTRSCAFIMTEDGREIQTREIYQFLENLGVAQYKFPDQVVRVESWPLTSVGKISKKALTEMITGRE